jgi:hypothetical protein
MRERWIEVLLYMVICGLSGSTIFLWRINDVSYKYQVCWFICWKWVKVLLCKRMNQTTLSTTSTINTNFRGCIFQCLQVQLGKEKPTLMGLLDRAIIIPSTAVMCNVQISVMTSAARSAVSITRVWRDTNYNKNLPSAVLLDVTACVGCAACTFSSTFAALPGTASLSCCSFIFPVTN